ncbi:hypothetical protein Bca4012_093039 [Brassica carinata]
MSPNNSLTLGSSPGFDAIKSSAFPQIYKSARVFPITTETVSVVNAIEIVSVVDKLFKDSVAKVGGSEMELGRGMETYVKNSSSVTYALPDGSSLL